MMDAVSMVFGYMADVRLDPGCRDARRETERSSHFAGSLVYRRKLIKFYEKREAGTMSSQKPDDIIIDAINSPDPSQQQ